MNWVLILVCPALVCSGFVVWFCVLFGLFCVSLLFVWFMMAQWTMYRSSPSSLLRPSTVDGLETLICITAHAMSYSVVNDLAKAMKALDGKKQVHRASFGFVLVPQTDMIFGDGVGASLVRGSYCQLCWFV